MYYYVTAWDHVLICPPQEEYTELPLVTKKQYEANRHSMIRVFHLKDDQTISMKTFHKENSEWTDSSYKDCIQLFEPGKSTPTEFKC